MYRNSSNATDRCQRLLDGSIATILSVFGSDPGVSTIDINLVHPLWTSWLVSRRSLASGCVG